MGTGLEIPEIRTTPVSKPVAETAARTDAPPETELAAPLIDVEGFVRGSPPWLISAVIHMLLLIIGGLLFLASDLDLPIELEARYSEKLGELEDIFDLDLPTTDEDIEIEELTQPTTLPIVTDPLSMPPISPIVPDGATLTTPNSPLAIGMALTGREPGMKEALTKAYGGNKLTTKAVADGLSWLARNQHRNGSWSLRGPYSSGGPSENRQSATAMALLAFQGDGHTHKRVGDDPYSDVVRRGWEWLLKSQDSTGYFHGDMPNDHQLYTHAQCTIAICELYGMTGDEEFREPAQRAIDFAIKMQTEKGGWRYNPGRDEDLSVTGWFAMALQSARMAGLLVPSENFDRLSRYLDTVQKEGGSQYSYRPSEGPRPSMTAEGLLCRQYLGWKRNDPRLTKGVDHLLGYLPANDTGDNVYHWYYATQVCHHMEGDAWRKWNSAMKKILPQSQEHGGRERGSWDPGNNPWSRAGGRLYQTCLSIYMLEVYYRHLPIYRDGMLEAGW